MAAAPSAAAQAWEVFKQGVTSLFKQVGAWVSVLTRI